MSEMNDAVVLALLDAAEEGGGEEVSPEAEELMDSIAGLTEEELEELAGGKVEDRPEEKAPRAGNTVSAFNPTKYDLEVGDRVYARRRLTNRDGTTFARPGDRLTLLEQLSVGFRAENAEGEQATVYGSNDVRKTLEEEKCQDGPNAGKPGRCPDEDDSEDEFGKKPAARLASSLKAKGLRFKSEQVDEDHALVTFMSEKDRDTAVGEMPQYGYDRWEKVDDKTVKIYFPKSAESGVYGLRKDTGRVPVRKSGPKGLPTQVHDDGDRTVTWVMTTGTTDRDNETVDPEGGDFSDYRLNSTILFDHNNGEVKGAEDKFPIGRMHGDPWNEEIGEGTRFEKAANGADLGPRRMALLCKVWFSKENPIGDRAFRMAKEGTLSGGSISFLPQGPAQKNRVGGAHYSHWKLLEFTICPVGSNPDAVALSKSMRAAVRKGASRVQIESVLTSAGLRGFMIREDDESYRIGFHGSRSPSKDSEAGYASLRAAGMDVRSTGGPALEVVKSVNPESENSGDVAMARKFWSKGNTAWVCKSDGPLSDEQQGYLEQRGLDDVRVEDAPPPTEEGMTEEAVPETQSPEPPTPEDKTGSGGDCYISVDPATSKPGNIRYEVHGPDGKLIYADLLKIVAEGKVRELNGTAAGDNFLTNRSKSLDKKIRVESAGTGKWVVVGDKGDDGMDGPWRSHVYTDKEAAESYAKLMNHEAPYNTPAYRSKGYDPSSGPVGYQAIKAWLKAMEDDCAGIEKTEVLSAAASCRKLLERAMKAGYKGLLDQDTDPVAKAVRKSLDKAGLEELKVGDTVTWGSGISGTVTDVDEFRGTCTVKERLSGESVRLEISQVHKKSTTEQGGDEVDQVSKGAVPWEKVYQQLNQFVMSAGNGDSINIGGVTVTYDAKRDTVVADGKSGFRSLSDAAKYIATQTKSMKGENDMDPTERRVKELADGGMDDEEVAMTLADEGADMDAVEMSLKSLKKRKVGGKKSTEKKLSRKDMAFLKDIDDVLSSAVEGNDMPKHVKAGMSHIIGQIKAKTEELGSQAVGEGGEDEISPEDGAALEMALKSLEDAKSGLDKTLYQVSGRR